MVSPVCKKLPHSTCLKITLNSFEKQSAYSAKAGNNCTLILHKWSFVCVYYYCAMHFSAFARSCDRMSSVRPSVRLFVRNVGDL